jgi:catechol 2,3-dioxygenase-like lactoylglutathione lyase family enzyme
VIGRLHHVVIDCADPAVLAQFYAEMLGLHVTYTSSDWVVVAENDTTSGIAFQLAPDHQPPHWPDPTQPQQVHLDVMVEDIGTAAAKVLELGARPLDGENAFADLAGHPFCLVRRPAWAPPLPDDPP